MIGRLGQIVRGALRLGRVGRPRPAGVRSGWLAPDGRVAEASGTAVHEALLAKLGAPTREGFFAQGAVRFVDAGDWVSLELDGDSRLALEHARAALSDRWAGREVEIEFRPFGLISGSATEVLEALRGRLGEIQHPRTDKW